MVDSVILPVVYNGERIGETRYVDGEPRLIFNLTPWGSKFKQMLTEDPDWWTSVREQIKVQLSLSPLPSEVVVQTKTVTGTITVQIPEIRTVSPTGGEKGVKPQRHSLIPRQALDTIGEVYDFGTRKYAPYNWRKGYDWSKSYDALQRHLTAWWDREENDPESGLSHLAHAGFHVFALIVFSKDSRYAQFDDRYKP